METAENLPPVNEMIPMSCSGAGNRDVVFGIWLAVRTGTTDLVGIAVDRIFQRILPGVGRNFRDDRGNPFGFFGCITGAVTKRFQGLRKSFQLALAGTSKVLGKLLGEVELR